MALPSHLSIVFCLGYFSYLLYPINFQVFKLVSVYHSLPENYFALATLIYVGFILSS
jgi:hypothetical protein